MHNKQARRNRWACWPRFRVNYGLPTFIYRQAGGSAANCPPGEFSAEGGRVEAKFLNLSSFPTPFKANGFKQWRRHSRPFVSFETAFHKAYFELSEMFTFFRKQPKIFKTKRSFNVSTRVALLLGIL